MSADAQKVEQLFTQALEIEITGPAGVACSIEVSNDLGGNWLSVSTVTMTGEPQLIGFQTTAGTRFFRAIVVVP